MGRHLHSALKGSIQFFKRKFTVPEAVIMHVAVMVFSLLYIILVWDSAPPDCTIYPTIPPFPCTFLMENYDCLRNHKYQLSSRGLRMELYTARSDAYSNRRNYLFISNRFPRKIPLVTRTAHKVLFSTGCTTARETPQTTTRYYARRSLRSGTRWQACAEMRFHQPWVGLIVAYRTG
jgi:hypothetical protein